jgi:hypothetical protein
MWYTEHAIVLHGQRSVMHQLARAASRSINNLPTRYKLMGHLFLLHTSDYANVMRRIEHKKAET